MAGDLILVWIFYHSLAQTVAGVTDTEGNTYAGPVVGPTQGAGNLAGWQQEIWYAKNIHGGTKPTVTATFSSMPAIAFERRISAHEYSGASGTDPIDVTSAAIGATVNASSGSVATTAAGLIFGAAIFASTGSAGPGFTDRSTLDGNISEDGPVATPGSAEATFINTAQDWIAQMVTLK